MIRAAVFAAVLATTTAAAASVGVSDRVLSNTVIVGVREAADVPPALYRLPGQRPTWFRRLLHWASFGTTDIERNPYGDTYYEAGAGVVIAPDRVLTAAHIVLNTNAHQHDGVLWLRFRDGRRLPATVEAIAPHYDAAVLHFDPSGNEPPPLRLALNQYQQPGPVLIVGNPGGHAWWTEQGRAVRLGAYSYGATHTEGESRYGWAITGEATNGSSGGPVVNDRGELLAIVSSGLDAESFAAVPADIALRNVEFWQGQDRTRTRLHCLRSRTYQ